MWGGRVVAPLALSPRDSAIALASSPQGSCGQTYIQTDDVVTVMVTVVVGWSGGMLVLRG